MACCGFRAVVNYLDDFLIIGSTKEECQRGLVTLINLLDYLGFNVSWCKVVSPTQRLTFLGIELDFSTMSLRLPEDKLNRLIDLLNTFSHKASAPKRQLQSLAGSLNFACQVVHGGRTFLCRVIDCLNKLNHSSHRCRLSTDFRANVSWWKEFLVTFNGRRMMFDFRQPVYIKKTRPFTVLKASRLTTGLLALGPLHERAIFTPSHCHPIGVMTVTLLFHHFVVISIIWNYFRFLSPPAAGAPLGQTNAFAWKLTTRNPWFLLTKALVKTLSLCLGYGSYFGLVFVTTFISARATWLE